MWKNLLYEFSPWVWCVWCAGVGLWVCGCLVRLCCLDGNGQYARASLVLDQMSSAASDSASDDSRPSPEPPSPAAEEYPSESDSPSVEPEESAPDSPSREPSAPSGSSSASGSGSSSSASDSGSSSEDSAEKDTAEKDTAEKDAAEKDTAEEEDAADKSPASDSGASSDDSAEQDAAEKDTAEGDAPIVERFVIGWTTLEDHIRSHNFPRHVKTCGPCHYYKNRPKWSTEFCCKNPVTQKDEPWLACKFGFALCTICEQMGEKQTSFGQGKGSFLHKKSLKTHARCPTHLRAEEAWRQRKLTEASGVETAAASATLESSRPASATAVVDRTSHPIAGYRGCIGVRALLETKGSFRSFDTWRGALLGEERQALESSWHCKRLVGTMAKHETQITHRLLKAGAVFRLQADGLDRTYQIEIGTTPLLFRGRGVPSGGMRVGGTHSGFIDLLGVNFFTEIHGVYPDFWWGSEIL